MYPGVKNVILLKSNKNTVVVIKYYYTSHEKKVIYARDNIPKHSVQNLLTCLCERRLAILKLISYHLKNTWGSVTGEQHGILAKGKMGRRDRKGETFSSLPSCPAHVSPTQAETQENNWVPEVCTWLLWYSWKGISQEVTVHAKYYHLNITNSLHL